MLGSCVEFLRIPGFLLDSIEQLIEWEETNPKFCGFQVELEYCEVFQQALNY